MLIQNGYLLDLTPQPPNDWNLILNDNLTMVVNDCANNHVNTVALGLVEVDAGGNFTQYSTDSQFQSITSAFRARGIVQIGRASCRERVSSPV